MGSNPFKPTNLKGDSMKRILQQEISEWVDDATGERMEDSPDCIVDLSFGYGSSLDGFALQLHFSDKQAQEIMDMLGEKYPNVAKVIKEELDKRFGDFENG